jgi:hypothetical protein
MQPHAPPSAITTSLNPAMQDYVIYSRITRAAALVNINKIFQGSKSRRVHLQHTPTHTLPSYQCNPPSPTPPTYSYEAVEMPAPRSRSESLELVEMKDLFDDSYLQDPRAQAPSPIPGASQMQVPNPSIRPSTPIPTAGFIEEEFLALRACKWYSFEEALKDINVVAKRLGFCVFKKRAANKDLNSKICRYDIAYTKGKKSKPSSSQGKRLNVKSIKKGYKWKAAVILYRG